MIEVYAKPAHHTKSMSEQKSIINQHQYRSTSTGIILTKIDMYKFNYLSPKVTIYYGIAAPSFLSPSFLYSA